MFVYVVDWSKWNHIIPVKAVEKKEESMPQIAEFKHLLERMKAIHEKKNDDYAQGDPFENFIRSAEVISWFEDNQDKVFVALITTKIARLATLLNKKGVPNNESVQDSFLDLTVYCALWSSYHEREDFIASGLK